MMTTRRAFLAGAAAAGAVGWSGAPSGASAQAGALERLREAVHLGRRLRRGELTPIEWQDRVEALLASCSVEALREVVQVSRMRARAPTPARGASIHRVPIFEQLGADEGADVKLFFLEAGRTDPPHCHFNMVAAHLVLEGRFRVRHYERVREERDGIVLGPGRDRVLGPGEVSSISDDRDNAHSHMAETTGVLLDVQQGRLDPTLPVRRRLMLDVERARALADGSILASPLSRLGALRRYG